MKTTEASKIVNRILDTGITQVQLSKISGVPQPRLSRWASGKTPKAADQLLKLKKFADKVAPEPDKPEKPERKPRTKQWKEEEVKSL